MNAPNFNDLLGKAPADIERPKPFPVGTYTCVVQGLPKHGESDKKKTPFVEFSLKPTGVLDDVDQEGLAEMGGLGDKTLRATFYLTEGSLWRLKEFLDNCGLEIDSYPNLRAAIDDVPNCQVNAVLKHRASEDGKAIFHEIAGFAKAE